MISLESGLLFVRNRPLHLPFAQVFIIRMFDSESSPRAWGVESLTAPVRGSLST